MDGILILSSIRTRVIGRSWAAIIDVMIIDTTTTDNLPPPVPLFPLYLPPLWELPCIVNNKHTGNGSKSSEKKFSQSR